jgi:DNA protecting protein DprA
MYSINSIEGLLFRSYVTGYNLSVLHKIITSGNDDFENELFHRASFSHSELDFTRKINYAKEKTERALKMLNAMGVKIIAHYEKDYPANLLTIKDFPPLLFVKGTLPTMPCAAIVGSRKISPLAEAKTDFIVKTFSAHHYGIVSGLALGIDTMAHKAALQNKGYTAAILPASLDKIYPLENLELSKAILDGGGALVSEQAPFLQPVANPFVLRNRIQSAFSHWVVPVEMGRESGTLYTLQYALKQNKKLLLCLPGTTEIDHHFSFYEGILTSVKKFKNKNGVVVIKDMQALPEAIVRPDLQTELFT